MTLGTNHVEAIFLDTVIELAPHLRDATITEIMVNRENEVWVERNGQITKTDVAMATVKIRSAIQALAAAEGKNARENSPNAILDARFGSLRIAGVLAPTAVDGHALCIRKHTRSEMTLNDYTRARLFEPLPEREIALDGISSSGDVEAFLRRVVHGRKNILVAGGTSSGKTTFLNALIAEIPKDERVVSIEDTVELNVRVPNRLRLLSNKDAGITMRDLLRLSLRLRPDRIVVGEVRGEEAYDLLQALNTGHDGGFATVHANSARLALVRLETLVMQDDAAKISHEAVRMNIASCVNFVIFLKRENGQRRLAEIVEIDGYEHGQYVLRKHF